MENGYPEPQPGSSTEPIQNCGVNVAGNLKATNVISMTGNIFCPVPIQAQIKSPFRFNIPTPNAHYKGRRDTLKAIQKHFTTLPKKSSSCWDRMVAIVGLGGMGKTETAYKFAAKYRKQFPNVAWIDAETEEITSRSFLDLAKYLGIVPQAQVYPDANLVKDVYRQIDQADCGNVLFIFDNAMQLHSGVVELGIMDYLPINDLPHGRFPSVLITTQAHDWGQHIRTFQIEKLSQKESLEFFRSAFKVKSTMCDGEFKMLYDLMHGFPLNMNLAASQIDYNPNKDPISRLQQQINQYIDKVTTENNKLTSEQISPDWGNKYNKTLLSVWKLTYERLLEDEVGSEALKVLQIMSFLKLPIDTETVELISISDSEYSYLPMKVLQLQLKESIRVLHKIHIARILQARQESHGDYGLLAVLRRWREFWVRPDSVYQDDGEGYHCEVGIHRLIQLLVRQETDCSAIIGKVLCYLTQSEGRVNTSIVLKAISSKTQLSSRSLTYLGILACQSHPEASKIFETRGPKTDAAATLWCCYNLIKGNLAFTDTLVQVLVELPKLITSPKWPRHHQVFADIATKVIRSANNYRLKDELRCLDGIKELLTESSFNDFSSDDGSSRSNENIRKEFDRKVVDITTYISKACVLSDAPMPESVATGLAETWLAILGKLLYYNSHDDLPAAACWNFFWDEMYGVFRLPAVSQVIIVKLVRSLWDCGLAEKLIKALQNLRDSLKNKMIEEFFEIFLRGIKSKTQDFWTPTFVFNQKRETVFNYGYIYTVCSVCTQVLLTDGNRPSEKLQMSLSRVVPLIWSEEPLKTAQEEEIWSIINNRYPGLPNIEGLNHPEDYFTDFYPKFLLKYSSSKNQEIRAFVIFCRQMMCTRQAQEKRREPEFFKRIHNMMGILLKFFYPEGVSEVDAAYSSHIIKEVQDLIGLHGASTANLIWKYAQERYRTQAESKGKSENGMITFRVTYCYDTENLKVEILNCRQLNATDSNGLCDPFVKVQLLPFEQYPIPCKKTKVKRKTLCPLFDETFTIAEAMSWHGWLYFEVKNHDIFGRNDFLGEAFMPLESIPFTPWNTALQDLRQTNLNLSRPTTEGMMIIQTLENRTWDQEAVKFAKKQRAKMEGGASAAFSN